VPATLAIHPDFLRKLGLKPEQRLGLVRAPLEWIRTLRQAHATQAQGGEVVAWASVAKAGKADIILAWLAPKDDLRKAFEVLATRIPPDGAIWAIIVKKSGLAKGELAIRWHAMQTAGLESGRLVDNKELRFDERYYGTRFVVRKDLR
jgi:hypothetical protein